MFSASSFPASPFGSSAAFPAGGAFGSGFPSAAFGAGAGTFGGHSAFGSQAASWGSPAGAFGFGGQTFGAPAFGAPSTAAPFTGHGFGFGAHHGGGQGGFGGRHGGGGFGAPFGGAGFPAGAAAAPALAPTASLPPQLKPEHIQQHQNPQTNEAPHDTLGYWDIRGLAAPIRMMYAYQGVEYEEKLYSCKQNDDGSWDRSQWLDDKHGPLQANNPLVNLPYLESVDSSGGVLLAQTNAILNFLARRFSLAGCSDIEAAKADMLLEQCHDIRSAFSGMCYRSGDIEGDIEKYFGEGGTFDRYFSQMEAWLTAQGASFLVEEDHPIHADFVFWEQLDVHVLMRPDCLAKYPLLAAYHQRIRTLPRLQKYFDSPLYKLPPNNKMALWGNGA